MSKTLKIFFHSIPVLIMVGLIPLITDDYILTLAYIAIILISLKIIRARKIDFIVFFFGFVVMMVFEYVFISTGVETFIRHSLFGIMPLWLPFLWAYGFVGIKRSVGILDSKK